MQLNSSLRNGFAIYCWVGGWGLGNLEMLLGVDLFVERSNLYVSLIILTGLVFSEYLLSGQAPPVKEVNDEEPLFPAVPILNATFASKVS